MNNQLTKRLASFSLNVIKAINKLDRKTEFEIIKKQLIRCSSSAGANYEEAQAGVSRPDFHNKVSISLKEMRESNYWLNIIYDLIEEERNKGDFKYLLNESEELKKILGTIGK